MKCYEYIREASYHLAIVREMGFYFFPKCLETDIDKIISEIRYILEFSTYEGYNPEKHIKTINLYRKYAFNKIMEVSESGRKEDAYDESARFMRLHGELLKALTNLELFKIVFNNENSINKTEKGN
jgi:hypothetical protein